MILNMAGLYSLCVDINQPFCADDDFPAYKNHYKV